MGFGCFHYIEYVTILLFNTISLFSDLRFITIEQYLPKSCRDVIRKSTKIRSIAYHDLDTLVVRYLLLLSSFILLYISND